MWLLLSWLFWAISAHAQVPVVLSPVPKLQFFDSSGRTLAFGCVFTYQSGTTTPLATYTDSTGTVQNQNPVILDAGGYANGVTSGGMIWLAAGQAYTFKVKSAGGTKCALGSTLYTIDGVGGGLTLLTTLVTCNTTCSFPIASQIQLFEVSLTGNAVANPLTGVGIIPPAIVIFQITQDSSGGHSFTWPANSVGGAPVGQTANQVTEQMFIWDGTNAIAIGPGITGNGPAMSGGTLRLTGQLTSVLATGTAPFVIASTTKVANLNVDLLDGFDWAIPGAIGATTPNSGVFTTLEAQTSFKLHGSTVQTDIQGTDPHLLSAGTFSNSTGVPLCTDAQHGATTTCTGAGPVFAPQRVTQGAGDVTLTANTQTIVLTESVTFPSTPGTYRADVRYSVWMTAGPNICGAMVIDTTNNRAWAFHQQDANGAGFIAASGSEVSSQTYAAGAVATFTLQAQCNAGSTANQQEPAALTWSPSPVTFLAVTPVLSN